VGYSHNNIQSFDTSKRQDTFITTHLQTHIRLLLAT
jgi:hypothetical protein